MTRPKFPRPSALDVSQVGSSILSELTSLSRKLARARALSLSKFLISVLSQFDYFDLAHLENLTDNQNHEENRNHQERG